MSISLDKALEQFDRVEANLTKAERLWEKLLKLVPDGIAFVGTGPEGREYRQLCRDRRLVGEGERVHIQLSRDEALVLFKWLAQHDGSFPIDDQAEQNVLWRVEGGLESILAEPFRPDHKELVEAARKRLKERE